MKSVLLTFVAFLSVACSAAVGSDESAVEKTGSSNSVCTPAQCGLEPLLEVKCPDGKVIAPICEEVASEGEAKCEWVIPRCPGITTVEPIAIEVPIVKQPVCTPAQCGLEPLLEVKCSNGKVLSPVCEAESSEGETKCEWVLPSCQ